jgi:superfamily II RNA helicase
MVKICLNKYPQENEIKYKEYFNKYSFHLSTFQKYSIEATIKGHHTLVTAHTGSGKTLPAEFAIEYFVGKGKKVIYTAPIKALSNQKFYEFGKKYKNISFGILTGDIKSNPEADVLIMTTEILLNTLYNRKNKSGGSLIEFQIDFETDLGCVIFDEVHYINDPDRGRVWEESIMMLPNQVQMIMLSATIDKPEKFANWCEEIKNGQDITNNKTVYLASTNERIVPLTHYSFITNNTAIFKIIKDKVLEKEIKDNTNKLTVIQNSKGQFNEVYYYKMKNILDLFSTKRVYLKRQHVLNQVCKHMVDNNMLPALCFVLSRKQLEMCAREITVPLLEDDSKVGYIVRKECEQIIRKLPNYQEYLDLPEYLSMVSLLEKGIAIHHSGVMPVIKEIVELLYAKGYIKLLFATETFSIGVNMPTKTVLFTDVNKFDGTSLRNLYSHEYTQMAGRAGRRGIDTVGNVIHLNNLFRNLDCTGYKKMLCGRPQELISKFKISYNLLLNLIDIDDNNLENDLANKLTTYAKKSMIQNDIQKETISIENKIKDLNLNPDFITNLRTPKEIIDEYIELNNNKNLLTNKKRKECERRINEIDCEYKYIGSDSDYIKKYNVKQNEKSKLEYELETTAQYLKSNVNTILGILEYYNFLNKDENSNYKLSDKGIIATHLKEVNCLVFADLIFDKTLDNLSTRQIVGIFSCFSNVNVCEDLKAINPNSEDKKINEFLKSISYKLDEYQKKEETNYLNTGTEYSKHYDLIDYVIKWCDCENVESCKMVLQKVETEKGIFLGEFVKAILKINNIANEMEKIAELIANINLLSKLREIPMLTLKYVATNQSLYV